MSNADFQNMLLHERALLKSFALKLTMNQEDAKDLLQDTYLKALRYRDKFAESSNLKAWLCVIMKNTFINNYRRKTKANKFMTVVDDILAVKPSRLHYSNDVESEFQLKEISTVVDNLKDDYKIPFTRYHEGFRYKEISDELKIPIGTVKSRIFLARQEAIRNLREYEK